MKLTATQIAKLKPDTKMKRYSDGNGLYLQIEPAGGKYWRRKYRMDGKEKIYSLGKYPAVSLADARRENEEASRLLAQGIDPGLFRKQNQQARPDTFASVANEWFTKKSPQWAASSTERLRRRLDKDILPFIGQLPIRDVTAPILLQMIQRIEARSVDTAYRALQECGQIFRYGQATGKNDHDPSPALRGALAKRPSRHFAAFTEPAQVRGLLLSIDAFNGSFPVKCALQLAPLFFVRIGELRQARWSEIDWEQAQWKYLVSKTNHIHIVPLAQQALAILHELHQLTGSGEYLFPNAHNPRLAMSPAAINAALKRMGYDTKTEMTGHGFRAMARTMLHEKLGFDRDVIEHQLAHAVRDSLGNSYNRTTFMPQRQQMMQAWADYLDTLRDDSVIPFSKTSA